MSDDVNAGIKRVDAFWLAVCPAIEEVNNAMLDIVIAPRQAGNRLSCRLIAPSALDGTVLHVPN